MKKRSLIIVALAMLCLFCLVMAACQGSISKEDTLKRYIFEKNNLSVSEDFILPNKIGDYRATWTSDNDCVKIEKRKDDYLAKVTLPEKDDANVKLTVSLGGEYTKEFVVHVYPITVYDMVASYVFPQNLSTVMKDFALETSYEYKGKTATIAWTVEDEASKDFIEIDSSNNKCIVYPSSLNPQVLIRGTFTYNGVSSSKNYRMTVSMERSHLEEIDYWYNNTGIGIDIEGYVVAIGVVYSKDYGNITLYVMDKDLNAGFYVFRVKADAENAALLEPGVYVKITGTVNTNYNGLIETNAGGNCVVDKSVEKIDVSKHIYAIDQDILGNVPAAVYQESRLVSLTNWTVKSIASKAPTAGNTATLFTLTKGGVDVPVIVSKYMEGVYKTAEDDATWKALCGLQSTVKVGDVVSISGILGNYKGYQIAPLSATDVKVGGTADPDGTVYDGQTAAKAIAKVKAAVSSNFGNNVSSNKTVTLPTSESGVAVTYELCSESKAVTLNGGTFTVTPGKKEKVNIKATFKVNEYETVMFFSIESGEDAAKPEVTLKDAYLKEVIETPVANTAYKLALYQGTNKKVLYAIEEVSGGFVKTTEDVKAAADVKLETTTGGYFLKIGSKYVTVSGIIKEGKTYISASISLTDTASTVFTLGDSHTLCTPLTVGEVNDTFYLGTYSNFATISCSSTSRITGDKVSDIDVSQFPARFVTNKAIVAGGEEEKPAEIEEKVVATATAKTQQNTLPAGAAAMIDFSKDHGMIITKTGPVIPYGKTEAEEGNIQKQCIVNGIKVTNDLAKSTTAITTQYDTTSNGSARFYAGSNLTIECNGMKKIEITTNSNKKFKATDNTVTSGTLTINDTVATITFDAATNTVTISLSSQVQVVSIVIYTE